HVPQVHQRDGGVTMADADGWAGPRRNDEEGFGRLLNKLNNQDERLAAVERGAPLRAAGIGVDEDGLVVDSSLSVIGDIFFNYEGSAGNPGRWRAIGSEDGGRAMVTLMPPYTNVFDGTRLYLEGPSQDRTDGLAVLISGGQAQLKAGTSAFVM